MTAQKSAIDQPTKLSLDREFQLKKFAKQVRLMSCEQALFWGEEVNGCSLQAN